MISDNSASIVEINGNPVTVKYGVAYRGLGKTTIVLRSKHVIEQSQYKVFGLWFGSRQCEIPISRIDSYEILEQGNSLFLVVGFTLILPTFGISLLLCLTLYFIFKQRFLIVRSSTNALGIVLDGAMDVDRAKLFMQEMSRVGERGRDEPNSREALGSLFAEELPRLGDRIS